MKQLGLFLSLVLILATGAWAYADRFHLSQGPEISGFLPGGKPQIQVASSGCE